MDTVDFGFEVKAADEAGTFSGYASTFGGAPDSFGDVVQRGAFSLTLKEHAAAGTMPALLWQHDTRTPIGRWTSIKEDRTGLAVEGKLTLGTERGREALALMRDNALSGLSIGFKIRGAKAADRTLTDIELIEISLVTLPANSRARIQHVRSMLAEERVPSLREVEALLVDADLFTRRQVKGLLSDGYRGLQTREQIEAEGLEEIKAGLERNIDALKGS